MTERVEETVPVTNPANGQVIANVPIGSVETVNDVVKVASDAFESWRY